MLLYRCDFCKKSINEDMRNGIAVRTRAFNPEGFWTDLLLCLACGKPVLAFLKHHRLALKKK